ncbi:MAG: MmcQ/YjbR family DNA-binding protein [Bryobacteraceae bacterium]
MTLAAFRRYCRSQPHATENVQWGHDLVFKIAGKMFAVVSLDPASQGQFSFKCTPEEFAELTEREGVVPAPYVARYHWVLVEDPDALPAAELKRLVRQSYEMVRAKLPAKVRARL